MAQAGYPEKPLQLIVPFPAGGANPDAAGGRAALDLAQSELDRFLLPVNPHWHGTETAIVRQLRVRVPV